jgi:formiminotetrahydrofolate cyclodeaminase
MNDISSLSMEEFLDRLGSPSATPGGGSASAICASISSRLAQMVANLTIGRPKFEEVQDDMIRACDSAEKLSGVFMALAMKDSEAFDLFMKALSLPKGTESEKTSRKEAMQEALREATRIPMRVLEKAREMTDIVLLVAEKGNPNAITDAGVSALLIEAAARGAAMNARINLASIDDDTFIEENLALIDADLDSIQKSVEKALSVVRSKIGT